MNTVPVTTEPFTALVQSYYAAWFRYHPEAAVDAGVAGYSGLLAPVTEEARGALVCLNDELRAGLDELDRTALSPDQALDFDLMYGAALLENQYLLDVEPRAPDPGRLLPVNAIYQLTIRPVADFQAALMARLKAIPQSLHEAREFLLPRAPGIPPVWLRSAVASAHGGIGFLAGLPAHPKIVAAGGIPGLETALHQARQALQEYADFLEVDLAPQAAGEFACGPAYFEHLLQYRHGLDASIDQLYHLGEELFARTQEELKAACRQLTGSDDITQALTQLRANHPAADRLLAAYREQMHAARTFVASHDLVTIPDQESLDVVETPVFLRHQIPFAAYCEPAPNDPTQQGYYYVTPPLSAEELVEHDSASLMHTCVHEAWPGHHLQFVTANRNPAARSLPRLLNASATLYEGWALYSEQLMHEQGFLNRPEQQFILLRDRLWRALRILIDIDIHTRGVSLEGAAERLMTHLGFPRRQALAELTWYSQSPTVPLGYATGWALINALRDQVCPEKSVPGLKRFHDRLLSVGSVALPQVIARAFGADVWTKVKGKVFTEAMRETA